MKAGKLVIIVILCVFILDRGIYAILQRIDNQVYTGEGIGKVNHFLKIKDSIDLIVFGSSRANNHIDPDVFGKSCFNIGAGGTKTGYSAVLVQTLPPLKKQFVLLQVDVSYIFDQRYRGEDLKGLIYKYNQNAIIKQKIDEVDMQHPFSFFFKSVDYNGKVLSLLLNYFRPKYDYRKFNGFEPQVLSSTQKKIRDQRLLNLLAQKGDGCDVIYKPNSLNMRYLDDVKRFCHKNNKVLITFTSPVYNDRCKKDNIQLAKIMSEKGITYFDFSDELKDQNNVELWRDENHMSKQGAVLFSKILAKKLML